MGEERHLAETGGLHGLFGWRRYLEPLGPPPRWPAGLWTSLQVCVALATPMLVVWPRREGAVAACNPACAAWLGLSPGDDLGDLEQFCPEVLAAAARMAAVGDAGEAPPDAPPLAARILRGAAAGRTLRGHRVPTPEMAAAGLVFVPEAAATGPALGADAPVSAQPVADILESMSDAFFAVDRNWRVIQVNARHEVATKLPREAQLGRDLFDLFFRGDDPRYTQYVVAYRRAMADRQPVQFVEYYPPLDLWTSVRAYPTPNGGLAVFFTDVTAQSKAQNIVEAEHRKFEAIFVDSPASMALMRGPDLVFEKVNPRYAALMGGRPIEGKPILEALPELVDQPFVAILRRVLATGEPFAAEEMLAHLVRRPGGELEDMYFDFTYTRVEDGTGRPYGVYCHAIDVTEKVQRRQQLKEAVEARDNFLSIASHELKTPVTSLSLQLQMMRRAARPEAAGMPPVHRLARTLDLAIGQVKRLTALIEDLLDVSRVASGKMSYRFEPIDVSALVHEVAERFVEPMRQAGCGS